MINWLEKIWRHIGPLAFATGFIFDYLTLTRIDRLYDNLVAVFYLTIVALGIIIANFYEKKAIAAYTPLVMQFAFGGLFSSFVVFYSRSASLAASWPFLLLLVGLFIGNEFLRKQYVRLTLQLSVFFFLLFSYFIFLVPILLGSLGSWVFLLSGVVSLLVISLFVYLLWLIKPRQLLLGRKNLLWSIGGIFIAVNLLYFFNIIPPIPLALEDAGIYYSVERTATGNYIGTYAPSRLYNFFHRYDKITVTGKETVYAFSSVFAPTDLRANIVHRWQYYDDNQDKWIDSLRVEFPLLGGRDNGYRGFSTKELITPGYWRVNIETPNGLLIGRIRFFAQSTTTLPPIVTKQL